MRYKNYLCFVLIFIAACSTADNNAGKSVSPKFGPKTIKPPAAILDIKYHENWDRPEYLMADSAHTENYLTEREKKVFYYLNLARMNPPLFADTYVKDYMGEQGFRNYADFDEKKNSLIRTLEHMGKLDPLQPNKTLFEAAKCHAISIGEKGLKTHDRSLSGCKIPFGNFAENISYGKLDALEIVMSLLIDTNVNNLGHRKNMLNPDYKIMGVSIEPHKTDNEIAVMDFSL